MVASEITFTKHVTHTLNLALYFPALVLNIGHYSVEADHYNLSEIEVPCLHLNILDFLWALHFFVGEVSSKGFQKCSGFAADNKTLGEIPQWINNS